MVFKIILSNVRQIYELIVLCNLSNKQSKDLTKTQTEYILEDYFPVKLNVCIQT